MTRTRAAAGAREPTTALAVRCEGIEKSFFAGENRVPVLRGVNFTAERGKMSFLVGPSGCGKTTLISVIGAILSCDKGSLEVLGHDLRHMNNGRLADFRLSNLGFIFQQFNLLPTLNAEENASLPLVARGESTARAERAARELLGRLGLEGQTKKMPSQLSGGQQQRVAIARALVHGPRLLICDEPTASLDAVSGHAVMELLRDVALEGHRSVIVVTHDNRIFGFADRISHMADGRITGVDNRDNGDLV